MKFFAEYASIRTSIVVYAVWIIAFFGVVYGLKNMMNKDKDSKSYGQLMVYLSLSMSVIAYILFMFVNSLDESGKSVVGGLQALANASVLLL